MLQLELREREELPPKRKRGERPKLFGKAKGHQTLVMIVKCKPNAELVWATFEVK